MELLDRYLQAVRTFLPKAQQDDIINELSANILSQIEDKEADLGRQLNEDEQAAILRRHGHPMIVAGRYLPRQHLIGPAVFTFYWWTLRAALWVAFAVYVVIGAITLLTSHEPIQQIIRSVLKFPGVALPVFAWVTLLFVVLDICLVKFRFLDNWNPRSLPRAVKQERQIPRSQSICELVFLAVFTAWWLAAPHFPFLVFGPAAEFLELGTVWQTFYVPIVLLSLVQIVLQCVNVVRPQWTRFRSLSRLALNAIGLAVLYYILRAGEWVVLADGVRNPGYSHVVDIVNYCVFFGLIMAGVTSIWESAQDVRRLGCTRHAPVLSRS